MPGEPRTVRDLPNAVYFDLDERPGGYLVRCLICHRSRVMANQAAHRFIEDHPSEHSKRALAARAEADADPDQTERAKAAAFAATRGGSK